jgi:hypothetical protein
MLSYNRIVANSKKQCWLVGNYTSLKKYVDMSLFYSALTIIITDEYNEIRVKLVCKMFRYTKINFENRYIYHRFGK